jgi:hypothetical protein
MPSFEELMNLYRNPGENGVPEDFADQLAAAYQDDLSVRDAAVKDREAKLTAAQQEQAKRDAEITRLKAVNYDLLIAAPKPGSEKSGDNSIDENAEPRGIDSLFEKDTR